MVKMAKMTKMANVTPEMAQNAPNPHVRSEMHQKGHFQNFSALRGPPCIYTSKVKIGMRRSLVRNRTRDLLRAGGTVAGPETIGLRAPVKA